MTYEMYSPQNIEEAIETVRLISERFELDSGTVLFFRKAFEDDNLGRAMTDAEWDVLSRDLWDAAYHTATDAISELQWADDLAAEDAALAAEDAAALAAMSDLAPWNPEAPGKFMIVDEEEA